MMLEGHICTKSIGRVSIISEKENNATYRLLNPHRRWAVGKTRVEDCLINDGKRCDWIFWVNDTIQVAYFVELKGSDVADGVQQLIDSIQKLKTELQGISISARLVFSKSNQKQLRYSSEKLLMKLTKELNGNYIKHSSPFEESLPE